MADSLLEGFDIFAQSLLTQEEPPAVTEHARARMRCLRVLVEAMTEHWHEEVARGVDEADALEEIGHCLGYAFAMAITGATPLEEENLVKSLVAAGEVLATGMNHCASHARQFNAKHGGGIGHA